MIRPSEGPFDAGITRVAPRVVKQACLNGWALDIRDAWPDLAPPPGAGVRVAVFNEIYLWRRLEREGWWGHIADTAPNAPDVEHATVYVDLESGSWDITARRRDAEGLDPHSPDEWLDPRSTDEWPLIDDSCDALRWSAAAGVCVLQTASGTFLSA